MSYMKKKSLPFPHAPTTSGNCSFYLLQAYFGYKFCADCKATNAEGQKARASL